MSSSMRPKGYRKEIRYKTYGELFKCTTEIAYSEAKW